MLAVEMFSASSRRRADRGNYLMPQQAAQQQPSAAHTYLSSTSVRKLFLPIRAPLGEVIDGGYYASVRPSVPCRWPMHRHADYVHSTALTLPYVCTTVYL